MQRPPLIKTRNLDANKANAKVKNDTGGNENDGTTLKEEFNPISGIYNTAFNNYIGSPTNLGAGHIKIGMLSKWTSSRTLRKAPH